MHFFNRYIFLIALLGTGLYACKKDLGNYTYHNVDAPMVDTATLAAQYSIAQFDNLLVAPKVNYLGDTANLNYQWLIYLKPTASIRFNPPIVLATTRIINQVAKMAPGNYYLELVITDSQNNLKTTTRTILNVQASIETGWLVLHQDNGNSEVDFIASKHILPKGPEKRMANLFTHIQGAPMPGNARFIGFARRDNSAFNWITVATDKGIRRMNGFSFTQLKADNQLFRRPQELTGYQAYSSNGNVEMIINNGNLQTLQWGMAEDAFFNGLYEGYFQLAPTVLYIDYPVFNLLAYDQLNGRFLYADGRSGTRSFTRFTSEPAAAFNPDNTGKDLLFMDQGYQHNIFSFFKDKTGNGRWLYVLDGNKRDDGRMAIHGYDMTALPEIGNANFFQVGDLGNVALYATGKKVYRYDYSGSQTATIAFDGLPGNETITCLRIFRPKKNTNVLGDDFKDTDNAIVFIATWDGAQGKLYEMAMNVASGAIDPTPLKVYNGFGRIMDMMAKFRGAGT